MLRGVAADAPPPTGQLGGARHSLLPGAREGLAYVLRHPVLRAGLACSTTLDCFTFLTGTGTGTGSVVLFAAVAMAAGPVGACACVLNGMTP